MRFKSILLILGASVCMSACGSHSSWFGEAPPEPPELKVHYMKNDSETIKCFKIIDIQHDLFLDGKLSPTGFVQMMDCSELLLLKGASHIDLKTKDMFTPEEIETILTSGVLGESAAIERWVKRFVALSHVLYGSEAQTLQMTDILEIFRRIRQIAPQMSKLSELTFKQNKLSSAISEESPDYWKLRGEIFGALLEAARTLVQNKQGEIEVSLVKKVILHQREYFDLGIREDMWNRFVEACFMVNKAILGHSDGTIEPKDIKSVIDILDVTFQKVFAVYGIYATKVWAPKEWVLILKRYEELIANFLDAFSENRTESIDAQDLAKIFGLIHVGTKEEADTFVEALVDLKSHLFQSPKPFFSRQDVKDLRQFFHGAIENAHEVSLHFETSQRLELSKMRSLWKSPFGVSSSGNILKAEEIELSTLLLYFIDRVIQIHDIDHDGKLSVYPGETSQTGELVYKELSSLIRTAQKMVIGFKKLMGESALLNSVSQAGAEPLGKIVIAISDKLLVNGDQDGKLNRYEILELLSFMTETDRLASSVYWDDSLKPFRTKVFGEEAVFRPQWIKGLYRNQYFQRDFPRLCGGFLNSDDFKEYVKQYLHFFHKDEFQPVTFGELKTILGLMRFVEYIFLKFDTNQDGQLSRDEIVAAYALFDSLVQELVDHLKATVKATGQGSSFVDMNWLSILWNIGTEASVRREVVLYTILEGKIPARLSQVSAGSSKSTVTRSDIIQLLSETYSYLK